MCTRILVHVKSLSKIKQFAWINVLIIILLSFLLRDESWWNNKSNVSYRIVGNIELTVSKSLRAIENTRNNHYLTTQWKTIENVQLSTSGIFSLYISINGSCDQKSTCRFCVITLKAYKAMKYQDGAKLLITF